MHFNKMTVHSSLLFGFVLVCTFVFGSCKNTLTRQERVCTSEQENEIKPYSVDCEFFLQCSNGTYDLNICDIGYHFNKETNKCDVRFYESKCVNRRVPSWFRTKEELALLTWRVYKNRICTPDQENFIKEHPFSCMYYIQCIKSKFVMKKCEDGFHFNQETMNCDIPVHESSCTKGYVPKPKPLDEYGNIDFMKCAPEQEWDVKAYPYSCEMYLRCENGEFILKICPIGYHFNEETNHCDIKFHLSTCVKRRMPSWTRRQQEIAVVVERVSKNRICLAVEQSKIREHPFSCDFYLKCVNRTYIMLPCQEGYHFNEETLMCDIPIPLSDCTKGRVPDLMSDGFSVGYPNGKCSYAEEGKIKAYQNNCEYYLECRNERFELRICETGYHFNEETNKCDLKFHLSKCLKIARPRWYKSPEEISLQIERNNKNRICTRSQENSIREHPFSCDFYIQCFDETWEIVPCAEGYHYNEVTQDCDIPIYESTCKKGLVPEPLLSGPIDIPHDEL